MISGIRYKAACRVGESAENGLFWSQPPDDSRCPAHAVYRREVFDKVAYLRLREARTGSMQRSSAKMTRSSMSSVTYDRHRPL